MEDFNLQEKPPALQRERIVVLFPAVNFFQIFWLGSGSGINKSGSETLYLGYMADLCKIYLKKYISVADTYLYQEESLFATGVSNVVN